MSVTGTKAHKSGQVKNTYVVDDDSISMFVTEFMLEDFAQNLVCYTSPEQALSEILTAEESSKAPFVVFLDLNMPNMNGWEFLEALSQQSNSFKNRCNVIILSSAIDRQETSQSEHYPMVLSVFSKPLNEHAVASVVDMLQQHNSGPTSSVA